MLKKRTKRAPKKKPRSNRALDIYSSPLPAVKIDEAILEAWKQLIDKGKYPSKFDVKKLAAQIVRRSSSR
jgi:hypothetical protein